MFESLFPLELFPVNGLDRSLHAPVLVGLLVLTVFAEVYGWTYAGLVVPGYLAAVFVVAPVTGILVCVEAVLTYLVCEVCGRWLPRLGVWSTTFGRERFFLFIVSAVLVRLAVEGLFVPWFGERYEFAHSRELYSLGLVLVPLVANAFWNAGFWISAPRVAAATGLTYAFVAWVLLPYTNFTTSRFEIANESVSLAFLESPHAHIILLVGALLGARNNVRYGWDYNGILVPALLAVAWYQPTKLVTTVVEALLVFWCSRVITTHGPLSRVLIVGSRRVLVTYVVGFVLKYGFGFAFQQVDRSIQMVDYFGFGYLLPTLLAVKMWNKDKVGPVIMPTLQVSIVAFFVGNALGFALTTLDDKLATAAPREGPSRMVEMSAAHALLLGDTAPAPRAARQTPSPAQVALQVARAAHEGAVDGPLIERATRAGLSLSREPTAESELLEVAEWITVGPRAVDPNDDRLAPRFAVRRRADHLKPWLVVVNADQVGSAAIVVGMDLARFLDARAVVVRSRLSEVKAYDEAFAKNLGRVLDIRNILQISSKAGAARLTVVGGLAPGLDVAALGRRVGAELELGFRAAESSEFSAFENGPILELPERLAERAAAVLLGAPEVEAWDESISRALAERVEELTLVGTSGYVPPRLEEMRLFAAHTVPAVLRWQAGEDPTPWQRALAGLLGYRVARVGHSSSPAAGTASDGYVLFEPPGPARRGNASWVVHSSTTSQPLPQPSNLQGKLLVAAPNPRLENGAFATAAALVAGLDAKAWVLSGALRSAHGSEGERPDILRSFYQQVQEAWLNARGRVLAVQGISAERELAVGALITSGIEASSAKDVLPWTDPLRSLFEVNGIAVGAFDGTANTVPFKGSHDPLLAYAARFSEGSAALIWLGSEVRQRIMRARLGQATAQRLHRFGAELSVVDFPSFALSVAECTAPTEAARRRDDAPELDDVLANDGARRACGEILAAEAAGCEPKAQVASLEAYATERNPYLLFSLMKGRSSCPPLLAQDETTGLLWGAAGAKGRLWLVPLDGQLEGASPWLTSLREVRWATAMGLVTVRVQAEELVP